MSTLTSVSNLLLLASTVLLGFICVHRIRYSKKQKPAMPNIELENQVNNLRISKMLGKLGVPSEGYFKYMTPKIIQGHINNCRRCTQSSNVHICDAYLDRGKVVKNMRFCPNYLSLIANSRDFYYRNK
jgi:hypothetical protein